MKGDLGRAGGECEQEKSGERPGCLDNTRVILEFLGVSGDSDGKSVQGESFGAKQGGRGSSKERL